MPSSFENMTDYMKMWRAVFIIDVFNDMYELANLRTTWNSRNEPLHLTVERDYGMSAGADGFVMDSYRGELHKTRHIRFSTWYSLGYFIVLAETPLREWDIAQFRNYNDTVLQSNNLLYYASLLRSSLRTNTISKRITSCLLLVWFWGTVLHNMSMLAVKAEEQ